MQADDEGFIRAEVNAEACIHCGLCNKVCPVGEGKERGAVEPLAAYVAWNGNEAELRLSSSGGIFSVLAQRTLQSGGVVCGAVYDEKGNIFHSFAEDEAGLERMRGSKYVQSAMRDCYPKVKEYLQAGRQVLFTGVPCQVAGLHAYLGKAEANLLTMEILCEGAPSPGALALHLRQQCPDLAEIDSLSFRDKSFGWTQTLVVNYRTAAGEKKRFVAPAAQDAYIRVMFAAISQGRNCYACRFREGRSGADITIGDMWAIGIAAPEIKPTYGASTVLLNTAKGAAVYAEVQAQLGCNKKVPYLTSGINNAYLYRAPKIEPAARAAFYEGYKAGKPMEESAQKAIQLSNRIAILNHAGHCSYGSNLTAYALQEYLRRQGHDTRIVSLRPFRSPYPETIKPYLSFISSVLRWTKHCYGPSDCATLNRDFETFIVGSDQVFRYPRPWIRRCAEPTFYLEFAAQGKRRVAYAASFGLSTYQGPPRLVRRFYKALRDFDAVSVRERQGLDILRERFDFTEAHAVLEPVFLLEQKDWQRFSQASAVVKKAPYWVKFFFFNASLAEAPVKTCAAAYQCDTRDLIKEKPDVMTWLRITEEADFIVTDSFHMMCFAIIFRRRFAIISSEAHGKARLLDLLTTLGLQHRLIDTDTEGKTPELLEKRLTELAETPLNTAELTAKLAPLRAESAAWLLQAIRKPVSPKKTVIRHHALRSWWERLPWRCFQFSLVWRPILRSVAKLILLRPGKRQSLQALRVLFKRLYD